MYAAYQPAPAPTDERRRLTKSQFTAIIAVLAVVVVSAALGSLLLPHWTAVGCPPGSFIDAFDWLGPAFWRILATLGTSHGAIFAGLAGTDPDEWESRTWAYFVAVPALVASALELRSIDRTIESMSNGSCIEGTVGFGPGSFLLLAASIGALAICVLGSWGAHQHDLR
jgi:hypothetical protein